MDTNKRTLNATKDDTIRLRDGSPYSVLISDEQDTKAWGRHFIIPFLMQAHAGTCKNNRKSKNISCLNFELQYTAARDEVRASVLARRNPRPHCHMRGRRHPRQ